MKPTSTNLPQHYHDDVTALLLAGGRGERMNGQDKGLVKYQRSTLAETTIRTLNPQVRSLIISCNRNLEAYKKLGFPTVTDQSAALHCEEYPGPIAGILAAMPFVQTQYIQLCPCDTPSIPDNLVDLLMNQFATQQNRVHQNTSDGPINKKTHRLTPEKTASLIAVPFDGQHLQPLHTLIHTQLIPSLRQYFDKGGRKIRDWIATQAAIEVDVSSQRIKFRNINRPKDLET